MGKSHVRLRHIWIHRYPRKVWRQQQEGSESLPASGCLKYRSHHSGRLIVRFRRPRMPSCCHWSQSNQRWHCIEFVDCAVSSTHIGNHFVSLIVLHFHHIHTSNVPEGSGIGFASDGSDLVHVITSHNHGIEYLVVSSIVLGYDSVEVDHTHGIATAMTSIHLQHWNECSKP